MKDLIKKILREETSGLTDKQIKAGYVLMNNLTKGYHWYHETPEHPFRFTPGSIWLINPKTKEWIFELKKSGELWYYDEILDTFSKYLNMEKSDFKSFIKIWVEDVLERRLVSTVQVGGILGREVEDVLERRAVSTIHVGHYRGNQVTDVLKNGKQMK